MKQSHIKIPGLISLEVRLNCFLKSLSKLSFSKANFCSSNDFKKSPRKKCGNKLFYDKR